MKKSDVIRVMQLQECYWCHYLAERINPDGLSACLKHLKEEHNIASENMIQGLIIKAEVQKA